MTEIHHSRKQPPQWGELHDFATELVTANTVAELPYTTASIDEMIDRSLALDNNSLEACSYYSYGQGMCNLLTWLNTGDNKQAATEVLRDQFRQRGLNAFSLFIAPQSKAKDDAMGQASLETFKQPAAESVAALPPSQRLLADSLAAATSFRRDGGKKTHFLRSAYDGTAAAQQIAVNGVVGPSEALRRVLANESAMGRLSNMDDLQPGDHLRPAAQMCMLHTMEFLDLDFLDRLFMPDKNGMLNLNRQLLPKEPVLNKRSAVKHTDRLMCPAMNIGELALLRTNLEMVWEASHTELA